MGVLLEPPPPKRDRQGRYLLPDPAKWPDNTTEKSWQRVTNYLRVLSDEFTLDLWKQRMVAKGVAGNPALAALINTTPPEARKDLNELCLKAQEVAGANVGRNHGTGMHTLAHHADLTGENLANPPYDRDLSAYVAALKDARLEVMESEVITIVPDLGVAGTLDRFVADHRREVFVLDLKTGKEIKYNLGEYAMQLAIYVHGVALWDSQTEQYRPMPNVNQEWGYIAHLPMGGGFCTIYKVPLVEAWKAASELVPQVQAWRRYKPAVAPIASFAHTPPTEQIEVRAGGAPSNGAVGVAPLAAPAVPPGAPAFHPAANHPTSDRERWIVGRLRAIPGKDRARVAAGWPEGIAPQPPWNNEQIEAISDLLHGIEEALPANDPATVKPHLTLVEVPEPPALPPEATDEQEAPREVQENVTAAAAELDVGLQKILLLWAKDAQREGRKPFHLATELGCQRALCAIKTLALYDDGSDEIIRAAMFQITGRLPHRWLGVEWSTLTLVETARLSAVIDKYQANDQGTLRAIGRTLSLLFENEEGA